MGREIRCVPPNWEHPKYTADNAPYSNRVGGYMPMYDEPFDERFAEWQADYDRIRAGNLTKFERECYPRGLADWLNDEGRPPDPNYYRPDWPEESMTWIQVYETVSEGTPVTPPFATKEELIDYLATNGDFWDQKRREEGNSFMDCRPWDRAAAKRFVERQWAPSFIVETGPEGATILEPRDGP